MKQIKKFICNIRPDRFYLAVPVNLEKDNRFFVYEVRTENNECGYEESYVRYHLEDDLVIKDLLDGTHHHCLWDWIDDIADSLDGSTWNIYEFKTMMGLNRYLNKYRVLRELTG